MEELKMNRSEIFNFALRRCLYFTWCNNLFVNNSKVCLLQEISLHIYHTIGPVRKLKLLGWYNVGSQSQFKSYDTSTFIVSYTIFLQFSLPVSCRFMDGKVRKMLKHFLLYFQNMNCLFTVLRWEQKQLAWFISCLIYEGLNFPPLTTRQWGSVYYLDLMEICLNWYQDNK